MTISKLHLTAALTAALLAGYALANVTKPTPDRPVLAAIARLAKTGLWFLLVAEPPPKPAANQSLVHHQIGADGFPVIDHNAGW